jgi:hypothetical protein
MNTIETLLAKKMQQAEPTLDIENADRKVYQIACQDLSSYFKVTLTQNGQLKDDCALDNKIQRMLKEDAAEVESFLTVWTSAWLKKWKQRVKLLVANQTQPQTNCVEAPKPTADVEAMWMSLQGKQEMIDMIVFSLVRNAEICGTKILAENIIKKELSEVTENVNAKEQVLTLLSNALRAARQMTQGGGPLIYVKVDKKYYGK